MAVELFGVVSIGSPGDAAAAVEGKIGIVFAKWWLKDVEAPVNGLLLRGSPTDAIEELVSEMWCANNATIIYQSGSISSH